MLQCSNVFPGARNGPRLVVRVRVCRPMKHPHKRSSGLPGRSRAVLLRMFTDKPSLTDNRMQMFGCPLLIFLQAAGSGHRRGVKTKDFRWVEPGVWVVPGHQ